MKGDGNIFWIVAVAIMAIMILVISMFVFTGTASGPVASIKKIFGYFNAKTDDCLAGNPCDDLSTPPEKTPEQAKE
jgi:hypothetical protein